MSEARVADTVHDRQRTLSAAYRNRWNPIANRQELIDEICDRLMSGEPMAQICRDGRMPTPEVIGGWAAADDAIATALANAREHGHDAIAMDALDISDNLSGDVPRDKLRVDTRLKLLAVWNPKRYGASQQVKLADADGNKLDTAPLVGELLGMMAGAAPDSQPAMRNVTPVVIEQAPSPGYRPRAKRNPPPDIDDLV